jgi:CelD/BcsL family acetyltransferase involved in cellulose biosynthesis
MKKSRSAAAVTVKRLDLAEFTTLWSEHGDTLQWQNPFVTPPWLNAWWRHFSDDNESLLLLVSAGTRPLGVAPLMVINGTARFMGSNDLCDSGDFVVANGTQEVFFQEMLHYLEKEGIKRLVLGQVRPDSRVCHHFIPAAQANGWSVSLIPQGASMQMDLPKSWENYLQDLGGKQRHEVRRKLRRVNDQGLLVTRVIRKGEQTTSAMDTFIHLFRQSRVDKKEFMTEKREAFFRSLAEELARFGMLYLLCLTIDNIPAAAVFCVEHGKTMHLYNNGFNPRFRGVSVGLVSKILTIRASIESGQSVYDFLSGTERYKYQLGGVEIPLLQCIIERKLS